MIETNVSKQHESFLQVLQSYYQLTKPRIIPLLLITTAGSMWIAAKGQVDPMLLLVTLSGGTLAAASAQTINCIYDRDIDYEMERTRHRPIPSGRIQSRDALIFAIALAVISFSLLSVFANLLAALLAMAGIGFYVLIYTHWLKRHSTLNIVIGGAAGAIPTLVGWAAVTGNLSWTAWLLFTIVFLWTPPHFWALALMIRDDYAKVGVPMLPVVAGNSATVQQIWWYTLLTVAATFILVYPLQQTGFVYGAIALYLGGVFIYKAWQLLRDPSDRNLARGLFLYSISYMMLLCLGMVVDSLPLTHHAISFVVSQFIWCES
ncbi:heme o synthase [Fischerella thermalis]|jgi:protoheme IX farnesyltransferase|uniref:heme o synthase n=3 Tax=Fischerella thermalis TaxID=372787 RepID=UPI0003088485|nr:heme o synthase [Fischerella thermalis]PMB08948.1 protoheme IX farnesyltransferase [Fischerella thermalis CCMEE 5273]RDH50769.1 protoheme IX farnesyltransferase [Mastigocladus laminosus WC112]PLZ06657.1 protoheme IX farnesyltransferase [Fischerella thermalis WC119]PLZ07564.1 protoheme IX farnesyltransferase [Fischerella thermalis WC114]PLZ18645.1 protoheme IX farnesyltransferase [Fischerella thermalis WC1110]